MKSTSIFLKDVNIEKVLISDKISFGKKHYKFFIGYLYNDTKVQPLHIMLSKTSAYVFINVLHIILLFGIKSALMQKKNLIARLSTRKNFWKPKLNLIVMKLQIFMIINSESRL